MHRLYRGRAAAPIEKEFPGTVGDGIVDRTKLGAAVFNDSERMKRLEAIVHPLVRDRIARFMDAGREQGGTARRGGSATAV